MRGWQLGKIFGLSYVLNIVENKKNSSFLWEHCIKNQAAWLRYESFAVPVRSLVASNDLPDYRLTYDDKKDVLWVRNRDLFKFFKKAQ